MLRDKPVPGKLRVHGVGRELSGRAPVFVAISGSVRECGTTWSALQNTADVGADPMRSRQTALALYAGWRE
jgi:hypothetical protein